MNYEITHHDGDCCYGLNGTFEEFAAYGEGHDDPFAILRIDYPDEIVNEKTRYTLTLLADGPELYAFSGIEHITASMLLTILRGFTEDHKFYFEQFYDDEEQFYDEEGSSSRLPFKPAAI